jgi:hypothetical protein
MHISTTTPCLISSTATSSCTSTLLVSLLLTRTMIIALSDLRPFYIN